MYNGLNMFYVSQGHLIFFKVARSVGSLDLSAKLGLRDLKTCNIGLGQSVFFEEDVNSK